MFLVTQKLILVSGANKVAKTKNWQQQNFQIFCKPQFYFSVNCANRTLVWPARSDKINGKLPQRELTVINVVFAGVNMPDHDVIFSQLAKELRNQVTPFVALLRSKDCTGVETHFLTLHGMVIIRLSTATQS